MIALLYLLWFHFSKLPHTYKHYSNSCTHNRAHPPKKQSGYSNCPEIIKVTLANTAANLTPVALRQAVVHKHTVTVVVAMFFSWKSDEQCHCFWKVFSPPPPLYSEVFFHTLFLVLRVLKHSSNFLLIPPSLHYHLTFRTCILSQWWKGHTMKGEWIPCPPFLSTFVFLKVFPDPWKLLFMSYSPHPISSCSQNNDSFNDNTVFHLQSRVTMTTSL